MGLDMGALAAVQDDLKKKSGGSKNWIQLSKIEKPLDWRVMDPLPSMGGVFFVEVPVWWIDGTRIISPKLFGPQEPDVVKDAIEDAKRSKDPDLLKLLSAKNDKSISKIQEKVEFWIPGLKFNWDLGKGDVIQGIWDEKGEKDPNKIKKFIEDERWKILVAGISALKAIVEIATKRGGSTMTNQVNGINLIISKSGVGRDTRYTVQKDDVFPMPAELYLPEKMIDPFELAQSLMFTDEYMNAVIGKYLYNEELPERSDDSYAFPELREKYKRVITDEGEAAEEKAPRPRPGARAAAPEPEASFTPQRGSVSAGPAAKAEPEAAAPPVRGRGGRPAPGRPAPAPARTGRPQRNLADDLANVD
jgi:hypothetical protein